jgi:hypothetical protein
MATTISGKQVFVVTKAVTGEGEELHSNLVNAKSSAMWNLLGLI